MKTYKTNLLYDPLVGNFLSWFIATILMVGYVNNWNEYHWSPVLGMFVGSIWTIWLHSYRQVILIEFKQVEINHTKSFFIRAAVVIVVSILSNLLIFCVCPGVLLVAAACAFYLGSIFWLLFDFMINYHRGKPLGYLGTSSKLDKFFSNKKWLWIASKVLLFVIAAYLYYKSLAGF